MLIIFSISLFVMINALSYLDEIPKDINELFHKGNKNNTPKNNSNSVTWNKTAAFDIQKIDIEKFMEKIGSINNSYLNDEASARKRGIALDIGKIGNNRGSINNSFLDDEASARKRGIRLDVTRIGNDSYRTNYTNAADIIAKQKICDLMLQVIYMARHGVRRLESHPLFNKIDIGYRVGILFSKMRTIYKKIRDIYQTMTNRAKIEGYFAAGYKGEDNPNLHREDRYLIMHHRTVKLHTDFVYFFWVAVKIDGYFSKLNKVHLRLPNNMTTAGISIENNEIG